MVLLKRQQVSSVSSGEAASITHLSTNGDDCAQIDSANPDNPDVPDIPENPSDSPNDPVTPVDDRERFIDHVNVNGVTYSVEPLVARVIEVGNTLPASSGAVYAALHEALEDAEGAQPMQLETPALVAGVPYYTVESAFKALYNNRINEVIQGSLKFLTVLGARNDKTSNVLDGSSKCITAGGVYAWFAKRVTHTAWLNIALGNHS